MEANPLSAPTKLENFSVTENTASIRWKALSKKDLRGSMKGYKVTYTDEMLGEYKCSILSS